MARRGELDAVHGRETEILSCLRALLDDVNPMCVYMVSQE